MDKQKVRRAPRLLGRAASIAVRLWNEEHLHRLLVGTRRFVLCALLMQANVFDGYAPFGLAMASAMMAHGAGLSAVGGVVCGAMLIDDGLLGGCASYSVRGSPRPSPQRQAPPVHSSFCRPGTSCAPRP